MGFDKVCDTFVGDTNIRGISGGQHRCITIGEMLQEQISVLCGDEIATGLPLSFQLFLLSQQMLQQGLPSQAHLYREHWRRRSCLETATFAGLMSSRFVNLGSPVSAVPGKVVMCHIPIAGVATAGINVAAAAGKYVTAAAGVVVGLGNACCD